MGRSPNNSGRGGGGRGKDRGSFSNERKNANTMFKKEYKFTLHGNTKKSQQKLTYGQVKHRFIAEVQKTYKGGLDIAEALRTEMMITLTPPTRTISTKTSEEEKKLEQQGLDMLYQAELEGYVKRQHQLEENAGKAYALLFNDYCSLPMQNKVEQAENFDTTIRNNPIELLKKIKELMHNPGDASYDYISLIMALKMLLLANQKDKESLYDYTARIKQGRDVLKSLAGGTLLDKFTENRKCYKEIVATGSATVQAQQDAMKAAAFEEFATCVYIVNSDKSKYGSLVTHLSTEINLGQDKYPKTIDNAKQLLSSYQWDKAPTNDSEDKDKKGRSKESDDDEKKEGESEAQANFSQAGGLRCYCCGEEDHKAPDCPEKDNIAKKDWWINKQQNKKPEQQHAQDAEHEQLASAWNAYQGAQVCMILPESDEEDEALEQRATNWNNLYGSGYCNHVWTAGVCTHQNDEIDEVEEKTGVNDSNNDEKQQQDEEEVKVTPNAVCEKDQNVPDAVGSAQECNERDMCYPTSATNVTNVTNVAEESNEQFVAEESNETNEKSYETNENVESTGVQDKDNNNETKTSTTNSQTNERDNADAERAENSVDRNVNVRVLDFVENVNDESSKSVTGKLSKNKANTDGSDFESSGDGNVHDSARAIACNGGEKVISTDQRRILLYCQTYKRNMQGCSMCALCHETGEYLTKEPGEKEFSSYRDAVLGFAKSASTFGNNSGPTQRKST